MSGDEKRFTVARAFGNGFDVCDGDDGDKAVVLNLVNLSEAHAVAGVLNSLAARSGSPEGWPEGADAEGAELVPACNLYDDINVWQRWSSLGGWEDLNYDVGKYVPGDVVVVARRKPKPVTRTEDVRAEELRPGMKPEGMKHADGSQVTLWKVLLTEVDGGLRVSAWSKTGVQTIFAVDAEQPIPVLVEEPNG